MGKIKKRWMIVIFAIIIVIGGIRIMTKHKTPFDIFLTKDFTKKTNEDQLVEVVKMERIAAKQIKNTFSKLQEIKFLNNYSENKMTGFTIVDVEVTTDFGKISKFDISMSLNNDTKDKYSGSGEHPELQTGKTDKKIKIIYSDKTTLLENIQKRKWWQLWGK